MKCKAEKNGICYAMACYSSKKCGAKDESGNPKYAGIEASKEFLKNK